MTINKRDEKFFALARKNATLSDFHRTKIGCVAVYKGKTVAEGHNSDKTHPLQMVYNDEYRHMDDSEWKKHSLHAEMMCLNNLSSKEDLSKVKLYIYRLRKDIPHGMSRPCPACMQRIKDIGIKNIYYTTDDGFVYEKINA